MRIEVIRPDEMDPALEAAWRGLQDHAPELQSPFYSPGFTRAVARHRGDVRVGLVEEAGAVRAVLPFHAKRHGVASPVGAQISDYQGLVAAPGLRLEAGALLKGLGLAAYDYNHGLRAQPMFHAGAYVRSASPLMDLRGGFEGWRGDRLAASGGALKQVERKRRKLERELGPLRFAAHEAGPEAWEQLIAWKNAALAEQGARSILRAGWVLSVLETIRDMQTPEFAGMLSTLHAGERLVAVHFGMRSERVWHWWFPTYDAGLGKYSPGLVLLYECALWTEGAPVDRIDLGRGTQRYKSEFANAEIALCEGSLERAARVAGAARRLRKGVQGLAAATLPARYADLQRRAFNRLLGAGLV